MESAVPESNEPAKEARLPGADLRTGLIRAARIAGLVLLVLFALSILWVLLYRFAGPPATYLTLRDQSAGITVDRRPVPLEAISPNLWFAVLTAEDQGFCLHHGFDWAAIEKAQDFNARNQRTRGASTITMQTSKNAFLWPARSWVRKGFEAYFTVLIEVLWPKKRILEVYLNIAEWGEGVYGAEAAAQHYFVKPASRLTKREAALLAAALPTPLRSNPSRPSRYLGSRATSIQLTMDAIARKFGHCLIDS